MRTVNLLDFLNSVKTLQALDFVTCNHELFDLLDFVQDDKQFVQKIDLGVMYFRLKTSDKFVIVDGLGRLISLSLLLHAICECYKKTTSKNESAINKIRNKYLVNGETTKLKLPEEAQVIYEKIIFGERLSGKEKKSIIFKTLHNYWVQIKELNLQANDILKMLKKLFIIIVYAENIAMRDLYYSLNKNLREIEYFLLIENYLESYGLKESWVNLLKILKKDDLKLFFKDFFITKFNFKLYSEKKMYENFVNYFETMLQYNSEDEIMAKIIRSARNYSFILNLNIDNEPLKQALIKIKMHNGEDTYAYILNIYEDYLDGNISEATFLEILSTIDEYLRSRLKTPNDIAFNDLINYLNAFITCK